jgi:uncharacterized repeat protein (TIGR01451 family)
MQVDIAEILRQWRWTGSLNDLFRAAETAPIVEWRITPGTVMPFMSSRENGKPVLLREVLWAGKASEPAYAFEFVSRNQRYRCITPKACSNFFLEELGVELALLLTQMAPAEITTCSSFPMVWRVRNNGLGQLTQVRITEQLPAGLATADRQSSVEFTLPVLPPGAAHDFQFQLTAAEGGTFHNSPRAVAAEGVSADATSATLVHAPALSLNCSASDQVFIGRPVEFQLTVKNTGDASEPKVRLTMPVPEGAKVASTTEGGTAADGQVAWEIAELAPQASQSVVATFILSSPGKLQFSSAARGICSLPVEVGCGTAVAGVPGVLLQVVDREDPVQVNQVVTYDVKVTNQGNARITNLKLSCDLPENQEFVSGEGATAVSLQERSIRMENLSGLDGKAVASWTVVVKAVKPGDTRFTVKFMADQFPEPLEQTESTRQY